MAERDDLWAKLCAMPRPHKLVDFPRNGEDGKPIGQIAMWVLTQEEQEACAASANNKARALIKEQKGGEIPRAEDAQKGFLDLYNNVAADEVLFRACRRPADLKSSFFPSTMDLRANLSVDEVGVLMSLYYSTQDELGPIVSEMTDVECEAFLARLEKSGSRFPLDFVSPGILRRLLLFSVSRRSTSSTVTFSPGEPPGASSSASLSENGHGPDADDFDESGGASEG